MNTDYKTAGRLRVPLIGTAAALGFILFFVGALVTHVRASLYGVRMVFLSVALAWAVAALVLRQVAGMVFGLGALRAVANRSRSIQR